MSFRVKTCEHIGAIEEKKRPKALVCDECVRTGGEWVHLRTCQTCGKTHCCDSSPHKHASGHYHETGHSVVASAEPEEEWYWCYVDELFIHG